MAAALSRRVRHPAMPTLLHVIEGSDGPLLVYEWVDGELLRAEASERGTKPHPDVRTARVVRRGSQADRTTATHLP